METAPTQAFVSDYREILDPGPATAAGAKAASWAKRLAAAGGGVLDAAGGLLYPPHCMACGVPLRLGGNGAICVPCAEKVQWIGADRCRRCGDRVGDGRGAVDTCPSCTTRPPVFVAASCAVACYGDPLRALVLGLKFGAGMQALPLLARLLARRIQVTSLGEGAHGHVALAPVPLARPDFIRRGFNQAEEMARLMGRELGWPTETKLLNKVRVTKPQATLGHEARRENLAQAFAAHPKRAARYAQGCVVLVDDVMTTGATVGECAKTLRAAGVSEVRVAVLARG